MFTVTVKEGFQVEYFRFRHHLWANYLSVSAIGTSDQLSLLNGIQGFERRQ